MVPCCSIVAQEFNGTAFFVASYTLVLASNPFKVSIHWTAFAVGVAGAWPESTFLIIFCTFRGAGPGCFLSIFWVHVEYFSVTACATLVLFDFSCRQFSSSFGTFLPKFADMVRPKTGGGWSAGVGTKP